MDGTEYITLKEAGEISGYSPDYIGQLIRRGKLTGKQVYANVAWVTTKDALQEYLSEKGKMIKFQHQDQEAVTPDGGSHTLLPEPSDGSQKTSASSAISTTKTASLDREIETWERFFRGVSMVIIIIASLFLILLFHVLSTLLDDVSERRALDRASAHGSTLTL